VLSAVVKRKELWVQVMVVVARIVLASAERTGQVYRERAQKYGKPLFKITQ
jgi:hypothetical protein